MNNLEAAILKRLESKSSHEYMWPRWPAADEASVAALEFFENAYNDSDGDFDYVMFLARQEAEDA